MEETTEKQALLETKSDDVITKVKGIVGVFMYVLLAAGSRICVQALDGAVPDFELNSVRCGCATLLMMLYFLFTKSFPLVPRENWMALFLVVITTNIFTLAIYVAVTMLPLATSECILVTSFLLGGLVLFTLINKEKLRWDMLLSVPMCVVGVTLVIQPEFIFHKQHSQPDNNTIQNSTLNLENTQNQHSSIFTFIGLMIAAVGGISSVLEVSVVKYYGSFFTIEKLSTSLVYSYIAGTFISLVPMFIFEKPTFPTDIASVFYTLFHCLTYAVMLPLLLYSSKFISGNLCSIIRSTIIVIVLIAQYTFLKHIHPGHRNWMEVLGVVLVLMGFVASSVVEIIREKTGNTKSEKI